MKIKDIRKINDSELLVTWNDETRVIYPAYYLQLACRCAHCVDEWTGERLITEKDVDDAVKILDFKPVGNYGLKFVFSSGCQSGIYTFEYLHTIRPSAITPKSS